MALADFSAYQAEIAAPAQRVQDTKNSSAATTAGLGTSLWTIAPFAGAAPGGTARLCTSATAGALGQQDSTTGSLYLTQIAASLGQSGYIVVCDRLADISGFSGIVTTANTISGLDVSSGTRYTDGIGVRAALEIYTAIGTTQTTATVVYSDSEGNTTQTSELVAFGGTNYGKIARFVPIPPKGNLAARGVLNVTSVTLAGSTVTAGNYGVTLYRPLFAMPIPSIGSQQLLFDGLYSNGACMPEVLDGACLFYIVVPFTTTTGVYQDAIRFIEV